MVMQKITILSTDFEEIKSAPLGRYYLRVLPVVDGDYTYAVSELIDHYPSQEDKDSLIERWTDYCKIHKCEEIDNYDKSDNVNGFILNGSHAWLDKNTRVGLVNLFDSQKQEGETMTTMWMNGSSITLPIDTAIEFLHRLEVYAGQCYNKTEEHKHNVMNLSSVSEIEEYDITEGYPEQLIIDI